MNRDPFLLLLAQHFPVIEHPWELPTVPRLVGGGEFCACPRLDAEMVGKSAAAGYIPMGLMVGPREFLLVKCHTRRCVLRFEDLHIGRSTRRRARGLRIRTDHDFDRCLAETVEFHPERWLTDLLCQSLRVLHREPAHGIAMHSVEIFSGRQLVAGEIGYTCGTAYTSLSGFHRESGTGSVQLACLGRALAAGGFSFWDLGMEVEYKLRLGARMLAREEFMDSYCAAGARETLELSIDADCAALVGKGPPRCPPTRRRREIG